MPWIDESVLDAAAKKLGEVSNLEDGDKRRRDIFKQIFLRRSVKSQFIKAKSLNAVSALRLIHPHFSEVIDHVLGDLALRQSYMAKPSRVQPILLAGDPGIGKTRFVNDLADALSVPFKVLPMSSMTAGFSLSGLDPSWSGSKPGMIFKILMETHCLNPIVLLDELDKSQTNNQTPTIGPLYQLLESHTAERFEDEFVQVPVNAAYITWVGTANDTSKIDKPIMSRMRVFEVTAPDPQQMQVILDNLLSKLQHEVPTLDKRLDSEVRDALCKLAPRAAAAELSAAAGRAAVRARLGRQPTIQILAQDLKLAFPRRPKIGFV